MTTYFRYHYDCKIVRVVDGDTVELDIDLGFNVTIRETCRLRGINAPEMRGASRPAGIKSKTALEKMIKAVRQMTCWTHKDKRGKYGRMLVTLFDDMNREINTEMVTQGFAVYYS